MNHRLIHAYAAVVLFFCIYASPLSADKMLIPMDLKQTDHLKAYGVAFHALENNHTVEWLLNYRGGSFLLPADRNIMEYALVRGVAYVTLNTAELYKLGIR